jgi:hypothetical protein
VFQRLKRVAQFARLSSGDTIGKAQTILTERMHPTVSQMFHWLCENEKIVVKDANQQEAKETCSAN